MSEINDKVTVKTEQIKGDAGLNFVSVHEGDKNVGNTKDHNDAISKQIEENEKAIQVIMARVGGIASRMACLEHCNEPEHFDTLKDIVDKKAPANEPAYVELKKQLAKK